jgi:hypothetical protein
LKTKSLSEIQIRIRRPKSVVDRHQNYLKVQ